MITNSYDFLRIVFKQPRIRVAIKFVVNFIKSTKNLSKKVQLKKKKKLQIFDF